jgi:predicted MPP superfamily phosphohydrolase
LKAASYELEVEDVEINPRPGVSSNPSLTSTNVASLSDVFACLNIQNFKSKRDIIQAEFSDRDVLLLTVTMLNQKTSMDDITLENYKIPYHKMVSNPYG